jgi:hypothetical protein
LHIFGTVALYRILVTMPLKPRTLRKAPKTMTVQWDDDRQRYVVSDEAGNIYGVDRDLNNSIGSAVREANLASKAGLRVAVKIPGKNGKLRTEYVAQPLKH